MVSPNRQVYADARAQSTEIDAGLRSYMLGVYNYMAMGVALTGAVAFFVSTSPALMQAIAGGGMWVLFIGVLGLGFFAPRVMMTGSMTAAHASYWVYAALWGALIAPYALIYTGDSIARAFFITAATFAGMSLYGYTTKRDLTAVGRFLAMATIGILIALLVNMFLLQSSGFHLLMSIVVVLVFSGLTAYETQMIKNLYFEADGEEITKRKSIFGAFALYGSFVTLFVWILQLVGVARGE